MFRVRNLVNTTTASTATTRALSGWGRGATAALQLKPLLTHCLGLHRTRCERWSTVEPDMQVLQRGARACDDCCRLAGTTRDAQGRLCDLLCTSCARLHLASGGGTGWLGWRERGREVAACDVISPVRQSHLLLEDDGLRLEVHTQRNQRAGRRHGGSRAALQGPRGHAYALESRGPPCASRVAL